MRTSPSRRQHAGFVSYLLVLSTGAILTLLMVSAYRSAMFGNRIASQVQLRVDYSEKVGDLALNRRDRAEPGDPRDAVGLK